MAISYIKIANNGEPSDWQPRDIDIARKFKQLVKYWEKEHFSALGVGMRIRLEELCLTIWPKEIWDRLDASDNA